MVRMYLKDRDIELLKFLSKYKVMSLDNSAKIYGTKTYQEKRMVTLVKHKYINRLKNRYITLGHKGIEYLSKNGIDIKEHCRSKDNIERLKIISDMASMAIDTELKFTPSWELKSEKELTKRARRYIGVLEYHFAEYLVYSTIGKKLKKQHKAICTDIKREIKHKNFIVLSDDYSIINKDTPFVFEKKEVLIVPYNEANKDILMNYGNIYMHDIIREIFGEILGDCKYSDYTAQESDEKLIELALMDTSKLNELKKHYKEKYDMFEHRLTIICTEDNKSYLEKQFPKIKTLTIDKEIEENIRISKMYHSW